MSIKCYPAIRFPKNRARKHNKGGFAIRHKKNCWACKVWVTLDMFKEANEDALRTPWANLGCGVNSWVPEKGRFLLAHPWGESITDIDWPDWVDEYGYWNNTDKLDSVSEREWSRRGKAWKGVLECNTLERKLLLVGFDAEHKHTVDMSWLELRLLREFSPHGPNWGIQEANERD